MAQFSVPQFIDIESKIVGPLTIKQFAFIAAAFLSTFALYFVLTLGAWIICAIVIGSMGISFALVKVGGRPMYVVIMHAARFFWQPKVYMWRPPIVQETISVPDIEEKRYTLQSMTSQLSKLNKLWQDMSTTKNPIPKREKAQPKKSVKDIHEQYQVLRKITGEREVAKRIDYR
jgi:hypothetical protein